MCTKRVYKTVQTDYAMRYYVVFFSAENPRRVRPPECIADDVSFVRLTFECIRCERGRHLRVNAELFFLLFVFSPIVWRTTGFKAIGWHFFCSIV